MSTQFYKIKEHTVPAQHIRSYPFATLHNDEEVLHLVVKQYTPLTNPNPRKGDVTIIAAHANGFPKELYEPLWDELLVLSKKQGWRIRSIWIADVAHQGWSSVMNEDKLGPNNSWFDHPRDLLHLINTFRAEMPRPLIGIGHSMGGVHLMNLALLHPRLLEALVLIDPVCMREGKARSNAVPAMSGAASARRRDRWPSRKVAAESFKRSKFYQSWDPRVLDRWVQYGLRELPTKVHPDAQPSPSATGSAVTLEPTVTPNTAANWTEKEVTLTTTKHHEVFTFLRTRDPDEPLNHLLHPELPLKEYPDHVSTPFYRAESAITFGNLPYLRPPVLYIFGETSDLSAPEMIADKLKVTGVGTGGSGGAPNGRVAHHIVKGAGHLIPMEKVSETAQLSADWITARLGEYAKNEEALKKYWDAVPDRDKYTLGERYEKGFRSLGLVRPPKPKQKDSKL